MTTPEVSLAGKTGIVTGASSGIGFAITAALAAAGVTVYATARSEESLASLRQSMASLPFSERVRPVPLDVRDVAAVYALTELAVAETGTLNIMVNNAGLNHPDTVLNGRLEDWREILETNVLGVLAGSQAAVLAMRKGGFAGHIVNLSSIAARRPGAGVYGASKAAVNAIGESLRLELQDDPIRVVQILPGPVLTNFGRNYPEAVINGLLVELGFDSTFTKGSVLPEAVIAEGQRRARSLFASAADIARAVLFAVTQPIELDLFEITIRPGKDLGIAETVEREARACAFQRSWTPVSG